MVKTRSSNKDQNHSKFSAGESGLANKQNIEIGSNYFSGQ